MGSQESAQRMGNGIKSKWHPRKLYSVIFLVSSIWFQILLSRRKTVQINLYIYLIQCWSRLQQQQKRRTHCEKDERKFRTIANVEVFWWYWYYSLLAVLMVIFVNGVRENNRQREKCCHRLKTGQFGNGNLTSLLLLVIMDK